MTVTSTMAVTVSGVCALAVAVHATSKAAASSVGVFDTAFIPGGLPGDRLFRSRPPVGDECDAGRLAKGTENQLDLLSPISTPLLISNRRDGDLARAYASPAGG